MMQSCVSNAWENMICISRQANSAQAAGPAQVQVYNQYGTLVATLDDLATAPDAWQNLSLPTTGLPSGVYLCRLLHNNQVEQLWLQVPH